MSNFAMKLRVEVIRQSCRSSELLGQEVDLPCQACSKVYETKETAQVSRYQGCLR